MSLSITDFPPSSLFLAAALLCWMIGCLGAIFAGKKAHHHVFSTVLFLGGIGMILAVCFGWPCDNTIVAPGPIYLGLAPLAMRIDPLADVFLLVLSTVCCSTALFSPGYMKHLSARVNAGRYWTCVFLFVLSMAMVILAANALTFLVFWEVMALSSVVLVASDILKHTSQRAALIYLGATRVSTVLITAAFLWFHYLTNSWDFAHWNLGVLPVGPALLVFIGLCIKSGIWPFHIWLPYAHPEAPSPVSALMSGVMVKVALYAMIRMLVMGRCDSPLISYLALFMGVVCALWGVLFGLMQQDLKRLLAYSTVENVGLILAGIGLTIFGRCFALEEVSVVALCASLLHVVNHGLFKSLLFISTGAVDSSVHTRDLGLLGGLGKRMPWTMACFLIGSLAICAIPPLNGFASKWLFYQSFFKLSFQGASIVGGGSVVYRSAALAVVGVLAFVGALSLACFTKAVGIGFLGRPRTDAAAKAKECSTGMIAAQLLLTGLCIALGVCVPSAMHWLQPVVQTALNTSIAFSPEQLFTVPQATLLSVGALSVLLVYALVFNNKSQVQIYRTWDCGFGDVSSRAEETGQSFSQPIGNIFSPLLQLHVLTEIKGRDKRHFPDSIHIETFMTPFLELHLYRPTVAMLQAISTILVKLQTGSIHVHLLYVLLTLIVLVCVGTTL